MLSSLLSETTTRLTSISDTPALDASVLIAHIVNKQRTWVMAHPELTLTSEQQKQLENALARLDQGESFPYVLGRWEFFGLEFDITPNVLIPRPETELLVEKAIAWLQASPVRRAIADVGTGSGAIAVSIAVNVPRANILATDISSKALRVAKQNADKFHVQERIQFLESDLLPDRSSVDYRPSSIDLICANLPYIPTETLQRLPIYGREPNLALDGGADGLDPFRRLLDRAPEWLTPGGSLLLEIESSMGMEALALARAAFSNFDINLHRDLSGHHRLLEIIPNE